ncbi:type IV secretion system protein [Nocardioides daeguensis]|uniref:type IV secretion system protein n=1 Tax=Nocardioides daeguensis TaxID=908359 RepID=UPI001C493048|nr:type IV secretion system protein [Nocardioides daeguensis]MBV6728201.1 type IV secretion system protein [Nocardioides daeguensis]MCR1773011.1 type IV secretion system protein [Nocardioides daeguensis]
MTRLGHVARAALAVLVLTTLLGAATALQPPAAAAASEPAASSANLAPVATTGQLPARNVKMGCPGPDALCDLGGDAVDCAKDPIDCGKDAADDVKNGAGNVLDGAGNVVDGAGDLLPDGCGILDAICGNIGGLPGLPGVPGLPGIPGLPNVGDLFGGGIPGLGDIPNPFEAIGDVIAKAAADAWTAAMLAIWNSGLFVLRIVLTFSELFLTPDLSADGPGKDVYAFTLWLALALVVILAMIQLGAAAFKREGKSLARAFIGAGQFVVVCACWFGYCVMIVAACGAITKALMKSLLKVQTWPDWDPLGGLGIDDITDAGVATALAFLGIFLWLAAIGHVLVYLARAASLLVLTATGPLSAAGLVSDFTRSWFWKSLRWFHAAAFTPVLMVMVLGIGVQFADGVAAHLAEDAAKAFGTALPAVMTILISVVAPLALFKLLAFVDPGTPSGASFRQGMAIQGGLQGLLGGGAAGGGSSAASTTDANGRSSGEQSAEASTGDRFNKSTQGLLGSFGPVGQALSTGMGWINSAGAKATSLMSDETNQAGVGQSTYGPDFSGMGGRQSGGQSGDQSSGTHPGSQSGGDPSDTDPQMPTPPMPPAPPTPPTLPTGGAPGGGSGGGQGGAGGAGAAPKTPAAGGGGGAAGGAGGAGAAAGGIPPVAV